MSEQNPWKKQMMMNKTQNNPLDNNSSPISQFPKQQKITPPWMKKNQQTNNSSPTSNQPSWMKTKQQLTVSQPAWMKNNTQTSQSNNNSSTPAWMQNKNNQQTNNAPAWKAGGTMFGADKKKKQEQQRLKKQQQERQRLQRQEQQRRQALKQRQIQSEQRQQREMQKQDSYSRQRQAYDLEKERQLKRIQEQKQMQRQRQRKRLQEKEMNNKKAQENQKQYHSSASKKLFNSPSNIKLPPSPQSPLYLKFLHYYSQSINPSFDYKQKVTQQKQLLKVCKEFSKQMEQQIVQLVNRKIQGDTKVLSQDKRNKIVNMQPLNTQLYYALCQGQQKQIGLEDSQTNQQNIKFDMSSIQKFQRIFTFYNTLTDIFCSMSKKQSSSMAGKFRVPLFTFIQYKGIAFLCEAYTTQILSVQSVLPSEYKQITNDFSLIEKELKQKYHYQLAKNDLLVKKVYINQIQQEVYIFYLKNWNIKISNNLKQVNNVTIEQLTTDYYIFSHCDNKRRLSLISDLDFQTFKKVKTQSFIELADVVQLAQCIFIVYSSCQGQVEQKQFWQLILSESEQIWALIRSAGYKGKLQKNKRFLFQIFQALSGVRMKFESKKSSKQQKLTIKQSKCLVSNYDFSRIQINEVIKNFQKYIKQNKLQLAQHSLTLMKELQLLGEEKQDQVIQDINDDEKGDIAKKQTGSNNLTIAYVIKMSKLLIAQSKISTAVKVLQAILSDTERFKNNAYANIPIKMELLLLYIKMKKEEKILQTFKELLEVVQFYYGPQGLINATLYQMLASYYSSVSKNSDNSNNLQTHIITLYQHATSILIKYYGDQSQQIAQLYLSRAVSFLNLKKYDLFNRDIEHALKIFKSHSRQKQKIAECLFYKGRQRIENQIVENKSEGIQFIEQSAGIFMKICHYKQAIDGYLLVIQLVDQKNEQNVKKIETLSNLVFDTLINYFKSVRHISKAIKIIIQKLDLQVFNMIQQEYHKKEETTKQNNEDQVHQQPLNQDQIVLQLQNIRKTFQSFTQIIKWLNWNSSLLHRSLTYQNPSKQKFDEIIKILGKFLQLKNQDQCQQQEQMQEQECEDHLQSHTKSQRQSQYTQQNLHNEFDSPIRKISKKSSMASNISHPQEIEQQ